ncbi:phytoene/squalene synthase family protein [Altererythrobacter salegens]|uniref:Phytoene/squalene synthase family protein n=1 Tax=Croceibacterium salegens TaxID=1737568 RepID=A0A6I4SVK5_9SPHN|nr:phytoene/squalene synthase family protein [Croceibacterium salegens]
MVSSSIIRQTPRQVGGGRERAALVRQAKKSITRGSKSFSLASKLFDRATRERVWLLYAWCRRCDDIADGQDHGASILKLDDATTKQRVLAIRILTERALQGQPTAELAFDAFNQVSAECRLTQEEANDVIEGFALDAQGWRPRTEEDLMRYCFHVAGAVGVMMAKVMGVSGEDHETLDRACDLGLAFQLVNIARDVSDDDAAGRCYIPLEWQAEADLPPGMRLRPEYREQLVALVARMLDIAEQHEAAARFGANGLRFRQRWAVLSAAGIYGAIGRKVRAAGPHAWDHRIHTSAWSKLGFVARGFVDAIRGAPEPEVWPKHTRGSLMTAARMAGPPAPMPMTPLPDEA